MKKLSLVLAAATMLFVTSCNTGPGGNASKVETSTGNSKTTESVTERNKKVVMASMEGVNKHDADMILKDNAPDAVDYGDGNGHATHNVDSMKMGIKSWFAAFPDFKCENMEYVAEGNKVMVSSDCSGTWKGDLMGMKPTGKSFKTKDVDIFTLNDKGQVTSHRSIQDMRAVMASIGANMPAEHSMDKKEGTTASKK